VERGFITNSVSNHNLNWCMLPELRRHRVLSPSYGCVVVDRWIPLTRDMVRQALAIVPSGYEIAWDRQNSCVTV